VTGLHQAGRRAQSTETGSRDQNFVFHSPSSLQRGAHHFKQAARAQASCSVGGIQQAQLNTLGTLPAIDGETSGGVDAPATMFEQRFAERLVGAAEGNGIDERAIGGAQACANMIAADNIGIGQSMGRQSEHGLGIAGAEGTCA
jgi:hypothetical protein